MSQVQVIYPYLLGSTWVFDDEKTRLKAEAFVYGMTEIVTRLVAHADIADAAAGFALHFSDAPFDGSAVMMEAGEPDAGGTWYSGTVYGMPMTGWLCPALLLYYREAPRQLHVRAASLPAGINPIWDARNAETLQFMAPS